MDFWPQHKDFVLRVIAGVAVFLVALIARGIVFGDDLEDARNTNRSLAAEIGRIDVLPGPTIRRLETRAGALQDNTRTLVDQVAWDSSRDDLDLRLIRAILGRLERYRDGDDTRLDTDAAGARDDILANPNGGFGQLRLTVRDALRDEGSEMGIRMEAGTGLESVLTIESPRDLRKHLLLLELATRLSRYAIDARVDVIEEMRIVAPRGSEAAIPDANPEFLVEYPFTVVLQGTQASVAEILNRLARETPRVPLREMLVTRVERPLDHVRLELTAVAVAANPEVPFAAPNEENAQ